MCSGTHTLITYIYVVNAEDSDITEAVRVTHSFVSNPLWAGELALEEHRRTGPAVDAEVSEARLVHQLLPRSLWAGRLEEALHPDCAGAATRLSAGQEVTNRISWNRNQNVAATWKMQWWNIHKRVHCPPPDLLAQAAVCSTTCISHQQCTWRPVRTGPPRKGTSSIRHPATEKHLQEEAAVCTASMERLWQTS